MYPGRQVSPCRVRDIPLPTRIPSNWFVSTDLNFGSFSGGTPTLLFDFPDLAPGDTATEAFDPVNGIGLFELQWDPAAPIGFVNSGNFVLSGEWWDGDPLNGGSFIADALDSSTAYAAKVTSDNSVPEPSTLWLATLILVALTLIKPSSITTEAYRGKAGRNK